MPARLVITCVATLLALALAVAPFARAQYGLTGREEGARRSAKKEDFARWIEQLGDPSPRTRFAAVRSLGESGDPKAVRHLVTASRDPDPRIASRAVDYLGRMRATDAADPLVERLFVKGTSDPLRHQILVALGRIGNSRTAGPILDFARHATDPKLRAAAIYALGEIGDATIHDDVAALIEGETDPNVKKVAEDALERMSRHRFEPTPLPENPFLRAVEP